MATEIACPRFPLPGFLTEIACPWFPRIFNIAEAQERVALGYFADGSVEAACPPLKALLHVMAHGHYEGKQVSHAEIRSLFDRDTVLQSDWYKERLLMQQKRDDTLWQRHVAYLTSFLDARGGALVVEDLGLRERLAGAKAELKRVQDPGYWKTLVGTLGADPFKGLLPETDG